MGQEKLASLLVTRAAGRDARVQKDVLVAWEDGAVITDYTSSQLSITQ